MVIKIKLQNIVVLKNSNLCLNNLKYRRMHINFLQTKFEKLNILI